MKHFSEISASAERVVDAAEGLIQERGYNGFSYDDVASLIGIKKPSIHHHFATKSELAAVVAQRYTHRFREQLLRIEGQYAHAPERLAAYTELFEATYIRDQKLCVCGMLGAEANSLPELVVNEVDGFFAANITWLSAVIAAGQQQGQIDKAQSAGEIAQALLCAMEGAMIVGRRAVGRTTAGIQTQGPAQVGQTFLKAIRQTS
ncbi:TetR/AcrR family transcriptional regulator [Undibacterium sp. TS12]|uniref:TetR/AcrR family transcriptional regulator n=1 Tax=Undibacterium sp. TS12 TaxID=2908202 RepID=UPI001F4D10CD|nr:TetR/AcrR family transcriptional regulator [Undibacterium sp. TS12]MCH8622190.1 TetR/AcrR family transcriptional regulator [Undibacterium sp. TS12]